MNTQYHTQEAGDGPESLGKLDAGGEIVVERRYAVPFRITGDFNGDGFVDGRDVALFRACLTGPAISYLDGNLPAGCTLAPDADGYIAADINRDGVVDLLDFAAFQRCYAGLDAPPEACIR